MMPDLTPIVLVLLGSVSAVARPQTAEGDAVSGELTRARPRLDSIDLLRGAVMVLMALDHVRDFFSNAYAIDPVDLAKTNAALFLTRWITHFCAPVFVFLAGTGAFLSGTRGKTKAELARFLLTRGLWIVSLEFTLVHLGWSFFDFHFFNLQVIWAIGWSMIVLAGLVFLPTWAVTAFGVVMIAGHNLFDNLQPERFGSFRWLWAALHSVQIFDLPHDFHIRIGYPLVPWIGVMAAGYGFGQLMLIERGRRRKWLLGLGAGLTLAFVALRATNLYGDPHHWSAQQNALFTVFSFINCEKYPPSLLYLLMTLGPAIALLALFDREAGRLGRPFVIFGRVPLFYYVLHLPLIQSLTIIFAFVRYGRRMPELFANGPPEGYGYSLPVVYLIWLAVVFTLLPACRWFARVKQRRRDAWLSYF